MKKFFTYEVTLTAYWDFYYEDAIDYQDLDWDHPYFKLYD
jgi:hypothetical protein